MPTNQEMARAVAEQVEVIGRMYSRVPRIECKGLCHESCGPIPAFNGEPILGATDEQFKIIKNSNDTTIFNMDSLSCPHLNNEKRCSQYEQRPLICRMYGAVIGMQCPHGCKPEWWMSDKQAHVLLKQMGRLAAAVQVIQREEKRNG